LDNLILTPTVRFHDETSVRHSSSEEFYETTGCDQFDGFCRAFGKCGGKIMNNNKDQENRPKPFYVGKIPVIALIFPPIGLIMLIQYLFSKKKIKGGF
jgi:hypothetical protein